MIAFNHIRRSLKPILALAILVLGVGLICWPFLPNVTWWWHKTVNPTAASHATAALAAASAGPSGSAALKANTLIIPKLDLAEQVYEGSSEATLDQGVWHRPHTSTPDQGGNTVLAGHRFTYSGRSQVFYHLDKLAVGDAITMYWGGQQYTYKVSAIRVVSPNDLAVEQNTTDARLTLYTCTPLWSDKHRLVIVAERVNR